MKHLGFIFFLGFLFYSCVATEQLEEHVSKKYYFYFDKTHPKMKTYGIKRELRHVYDLDIYEPIIFIPYDSIERKIKFKNLKKYHVKNYEWLNSLSWKEISHLFFKITPVKEYYLIEKRQSEKVLYIRRVQFIQEICD